MKSQSNQILLLLFIFLLYTVDGCAQQETVSLSSGGSPIVKGYGQGTASSFALPKGSALDANLNFGDVSPGGSQVIQITMPIKLSASNRYKVELQRTAAISDSVQPGDIGFSVQNARAQVNGSQSLSTNAVYGSRIVGRFNAPPLTIRGGRPQFQTTLADIGETPTVILTGEPTVENGLVGKNENSIIVDLVFTMARQYYKSADSFNLNLIVTITPLDYSPARTWGEISQQP